MSKPIMVANWKNYPSSLIEVKTLVKGLSAKKILYKKTHLFVAPPLPYFDFVSEKIRNYAHLASQDISLTTGTTTGAVTPEILKSFGTKLTIIGHSERRALGEASSEGSRQIKIALRAGITPLVCVGEPTRDADGVYFEFLPEETAPPPGGLPPKAFKSSVNAITYAPAWAIGKD